MTGARYEVQIVNPADGTPRIWDVYADRERAESVAATLRHHGFFAQVHRVDAEPEQPEHNGDRRRFLVWALMLGAIPPERVVERIVAEVEGEAAS